MTEKHEFKKFREQDIDKTLAVAIPGGISMFLSFFILDKLLNLANWKLILLTRIAISIISLLILLVSVYLKKKNISRSIMPGILLFFVTIYSGLITLFAGGLLSNYWAGFVFVILAWCSAFPQSFKTSIVTSLIFILIYNLIVVIPNIGYLDKYLIQFLESNIFIFGALVVGAVASYNTEYNKYRTFTAQKELGIEKSKVENLLLNILPEQIAKRLQNGETTISEYFDEVAILFADIVGFTEFCSERTSSEIVDVLNKIFFAFDSKAEELQIEKIKTIGDGYMAMAGGLRQNTENILKTIELGDFMIQYIEKLRLEKNIDFKIRVGIHIGSVTAGVIGKTKFAFDIWGDTVNVASRMESSGVPMEIHITESVANKLNDIGRCSLRGEINVKGKGIMKTYIINRYDKKVV